MEPSEGCVGKNAGLIFSHVCIGFLATQFCKVRFRNAASFEVVLHHANFLKVAVNIFSSLGANLRVLVLCIFCCRSQSEPTVDTGITGTLHVGMAGCRCVYEVFTLVVLANSHNCVPSSTDTTHK